MTPDEQRAMGSWAHTCIHHNDEQRAKAKGCPVCATAELDAMTVRAEKAEAALADHITALEIANRSADEQMRYKREAERLWKDFITLMDITEESDSGYAFNVNKISSCRAMDGRRLNEILNEARQNVFSKQ
jgi:hypothetical protein